MTFRMQIKPMSFVRTAFRLSCTIALCFLLTAGAAGLSRASDYRLGAMDKVRIRVAEWQTAEGTVRDWTAVSGDYSVGADGRLSLPFLGDLDASGRTTREVGEEIGEKLQQLFGLRDRPSASVELAQYRPVYLSGAVETPGAYPFAPDLTVLKAVSLAGGLRRGEPGQRYARDFLRANGDASVLIAERNRLLVRRARLKAEIAGAPEVSLPEELQGTPDAKALLASETALMQTRDKRQKLQLKALADLKSLLENEIEALSKKSETQTRQLELVEGDRQKVDSLAEKGLAISSRKLSLEQRVADLQAALLDIDTASLKAKQDISKASQDETNIRNDWDAQLAEELQNTENELEAVELKLGTSRDLMGEALMQSADAVTLSHGDIRFTIVRETDGKASEMAADENTRVMPGDVVKVGIGDAVAIQ